MNLWVLLLAAWSCVPAQTVGKETTFTCARAIDRELAERYADEKLCNEAADHWKRGARPDMLLMHTASCVPVPAPVDPKKK